MIELKAKGLMTGRFGKNKEVSMIDMEMTVIMMTMNNKEGKFSTLSISDERGMVMLQVAVNDELRKALKQL